MLTLSSHSEVLFVISRLLLWELPFQVEFYNNKYELRIINFGDTRSTVALTTIYNQLLEAMRMHLVD